MKTDPYALIKQERTRQELKWGDQSEQLNGCWLAILTEEVGEVAKGLLEDKSRWQVMHELIQVAAVALAWIEALQRKGVDA